MLDKGGNLDSADSSVDDSLYGAVAMFFVGATNNGQTFAVRFEYLHSSMQVEPMALWPGCRHVDTCGTRSVGYLHRTLNPPLGCWAMSRGFSVGC